MIKIGITGGIGSGKSTVSEIFSLCGIPVYIADIESKKLVSTSPVIRDKLTGVFGKDLYEGGVLNKPLLASYIFHDKKKLEIANNIIHPEVEKDFRSWAERHKNYPIVAKESAILFESGFNKFVDTVVTVYTPVEIRIERTIERDHSNREQVLDRINNQMSDEEKVKLSDFTIVNDSTQSLIEQVLSILHKFNYYS